uniref:Uncharacterized protein n=1 Tax=Clandestinovirus TaxID=2831644 RepID=A0A8F8PMS5_9VIRU|nr:hypothetical protein KOM_12_532 [Clandestinovirus]
MSTLGDDFTSMERIRIAQRIASEPGRKWTDMHVYLTAVDMSCHLSEQGLRAERGNHCSDEDLVKHMMDRLYGYGYPTDHFVRVLSTLGLGSALDYIRQNCPKVKIPQNPVAVPSPNTFNPYPVTQDPSAGQKMEVEPKYCTLEQFELFKNNMENYCLSVSKAHEEIVSDFKQRFVNMYKFVQEQFDLVAIKTDTEMKREMTNILTQVKAQITQLSKAFDEYNAAVPSAPTQTNEQKPVAVQPRVLYLKDVPTSYVNETIAKEIASSAHWRNFGLYFNEQDESIPDIISYELEAEFGHLPSLRLVERMLTKLAKAGATVPQVTYALKKIGLNNVAMLVSQKFNL